MSTPSATDTTAASGAATQPDGAHDGDARRARARHAAAQGAMAAGLAAAGAVGGAVLASRNQASRKLTRFGRRKRPAMRTAITKRLS